MPRSTEDGDRNREEIRRIRARGVVRGRAEGQALVAPATLSFWGEVDPATGRVIATRHPLAGQSLSQRILIIQSTRGSSATPLVLGLAHRAGNAPRAIVNTQVDALAVLGCVVHRIPMLTDLQQDPFAVIKTGDYVEVDADQGWIRVVKRTEPHGTSPRATLTK